MPTLTPRVCAALTDLAASPLPESARRAALRTFVNVVGTTIGAGRDRAVDIAVAHGTPGTAPVLGRRERLDAFTAALATGIAAHLDDFDDTHLRTVIHPGAATLAAVLPLGLARKSDGATVLRAFALGCEAQLRLGNAVSPSHYDAGWHITGTCGVVGAAVAASVLCGLDAAGTERAVALATTQTLGHREALGSMTKPFHPGKAAANGLLAALLAERGCTGPADALTVFLDTFADRADPAELTDGLGERWELGLNTFKPYPCGIVAHPAIDAALDAAPRVPDPTAVREIVLDCHPLVPELMGRLAPTDGLQARFSAAHTMAAALVDGELTLRQFRDAAVLRPEVARLRNLVRFAPSDAVRRDEARIAVRLDGGAEVVAHVEHARGSLDRPLTDAELTAKATALIDDDRAAPVLDAAWALPAAAGLDALVAAATPDERKEAS